MCLEVALSWGDWIIKALTLSVDQSTDETQSDDIIGIRWEREMGPGLRKWVIGTWPWMLRLIPGPFLSMLSLSASHHEGSFLFLPWSQLKWPETVSKGAMARGWRFATSHRLAWEDSAGNLRPWAEAAKGEKSIMKHIQGENVQGHGNFNWQSPEMTQCLVYLERFTAGAEWLEENWRRWSHGAGREPVLKEQSAISWEQDWPPVWKLSEQPAERGQWLILVAVESWEAVGADCIS